MVALQVPLQQKLELLKLLLQHERERLETWAKPLEPGASSASAADAAWKQRVNTAWTINPRLGLALLDRSVITLALRSLQVTTPSWSKLFIPACHLTIS